MMTPVFPQFSNSGISPAASVTMARLVSGLEPRAVGAADAGGLALAVEGVDLEHLDAPDRLDRVADLGLAGALVHLERVDAGLHEVVALLGDDRRHDDVAWILHHSLSFCWRHLLARLGEPGGLGASVGVEPHLGHGAVVERAAGRVVQHRAGVALDVVARRLRTIGERLDGTGPFGGRDWRPLRFGRCLRPTRRWRFPSMVGTGVRFASAAASVRLVAGASLLMVGTGVRFASAAASVRLVAGASLVGRGRLLGGGRL